MASTTISDGAVIVGGVVSLIVISLSISCYTFPEVSDAVQVIVVMPIGNVSGASFEKDSTEIIS